MSLSKTVKYWALYDFANSSYVLVFQSFLLPVFFSNVLSGMGVTLGSWGLVNGISTAIGLALSVIAGGYADKNIRIKVFKKLILFSFIGMFTLSLCVGFYQSAVPVLFILTNAFFIATITLSDSILPHLSKNISDTYTNSGFAWGMGYVGGILSLLIVIVLQKTVGEYSFVVFLSVAFFYLLFSIIAMYGLKSASLNSNAGKHEQPLLNISNKDKKIVLLGFWLISECITVIILFYSIYASKEVGLSTFEIGLTLLVVQVVAIPATYYGGKLVCNVAPINLLGITMLIWSIIVLLLVINMKWYTLIPVVIFTGFVIGNSQSYLRSVFSTIILKSKSGFEFGKFALVTQAAVLFGPVFYGYASDELGSQRIPLIVLLMFMIAGYYLIYHVFRKNQLSRKKV